MLCLPINHNADQIFKILWQSLISFQLESVCDMKHPSPLVGLFASCVSACFIAVGARGSSTWACLCLFFVFEWMILALSITRKANIQGLLGLCYTASTVSGWLVYLSRGAIHSSFSTRYGSQCARPMAPHTHHHFLSGALEEATLLAKLNTVSTVTVASLSCRLLCSHSVGRLCAATDVMKGVGFKWKTSW